MEPICFCQMAYSNTTNSLPEARLEISESASSRSPVPVWWLLLVAPIIYGWFLSLTNLAWTTNSLLKLRTKKRAKPRSILNPIYILSLAARAYEGIDSTQKQISSQSVFEYRVLSNYFERWSDHLVNYFHFCFFFWQEYRRSCVLYYYLIVQTILYRICKEARLDSTDFWSPTKIGWAYSLANLLQNAVYLKVCIITVIRREARHRSGIEALR